MFFYTGTSSFHFISVWFLTQIGFLSSNMANATPQSGSSPLAEENHSVLLQQLFMLACIHPLYMSCLCFPALYQVTRHGCAVCLMEMLCRKRPCVLNICTSVMGYSWVPLSVTVCLIRLSSCDCKQTCEYSKMEEIPETGVLTGHCIYYCTRKGAWCMHTAESPAIMV